MNLVTRSTGVVGIDFAMVWNLRGIYDRHSRDLGVVGIDFAMVWNPNRTEDSESVLRKGVVGIDFAMVWNPSPDNLLILNVKLDRFPNKTEISN